MASDSAQDPHTLTARMSYRAALLKTLRAAGAADWRLANVSSLSTAISTNVKISARVVRPMMLPQGRSSAKARCCGETTESKTVSARIVVVVAWVAVEKIGSSKSSSIRQATDEGFMVCLVFLVFTLHYRCQLLRQSFFLLLGL
mmetsp:Transcript_17035/g.37228  ORF Transcript_17035/g.37228 Transcript_17035/m.37228 type:complete len:144 (+) Transcript_17035:3109-3540(+)